MLVGYGVGDEHINYWIKESSLIHTQHHRVIEIADRKDPRLFASQRFAAYDLKWSDVGDSLFVSAAGAHYLTYTGGLSATAPLPIEDFSAFMER
jgi:hypothetical protein